MKPQMNTDGHGCGGNAAFSLLQPPPIAGIRTLNIVRRAAAGEHLARIPGAVVLVHEGGPTEALAAGVARATGGAPVKLGIDAIGGTATNALAACLSEGATVVNYGLLSGKPCEIDPKHLVFRGLTLTGFWVSKWFEQSDQAAIRALYDELLARLTDGTLRAEIAAVYPLARIKEAAAHAARQARAGKILLSGE